MDIRYIGHSAVALYLNGTDLKERKMSSESIDVREASKLLDVEGWDCAEFEIFAGKDSLLVIAWDKSRNPCCFTFETFEDMLSAVAGCPPDPGAKLLFYKGRYVLAVYPEKGEPPAPSLLEYGRLIGSTEGFALHAAEQGEEIISANAVNLLKRLL